MAKQEQRILKFLAKNADRTPTIIDMMNALKMNIPDIVASLESLSAQGLAGKRVNAQGIECWFPASSAGPGSPSATPTQNFARPSGSESTIMPRTEAAAPIRPAFPELTSPRGGVGTATFLIGLLITGAAAAWIGGHVLARDTVQSSVNDLAKQKALDEAITTWTDFEAEILTQTKTLEAKVQSLSATVDSLKGLPGKAPADTTALRKTRPTENAAPPKAPIKSGHRKRRNS